VTRKIKGGRESDSFFLFDGSVTGVTALSLAPGGPSTGTIYRPDLWKVY